jgi:hypothetical protein
LATSASLAYGSIHVAEEALLAYDDAALSLLS